MVRPFFPVDGGGDVLHMVEHAREARERTESNFQCNIRNRHVAGSEQAASLTYSQLMDEFDEAGPQLNLQQLAQIRYAEMKQLREIGQR